MILNKLVYSLYNIEQKYAVRILCTVQINHVTSKPIKVSF